ncbi:MAG: DUF3310 domain-containing protein [Phascolarctobacterium sp.]
MDKQEAYALYLKLSDECTKQTDCYTCPFFVQVNGQDKCILANFSALKVVSSVKGLLAEQEQKPSVPLENVGTIIVHGGVDEQAYEKLSKALDGAGSLIAHGISHLNEPKSMQNNIFVPSVNAKQDNVNSPKHYCKGGLECIQVIKAQLTPEQNKGYLYGNVLKYMWRWPEKNGLEDLRKAEHYLKWLIEEVQKNG